MLTLNTNVASYMSQNALNRIMHDIVTSSNRLNTGKRINSAADDAAGLAIATRMDSDIRGMAVAKRNVNDGISMAQTADGALAQVQDILGRMRELAVQSANATNGTGDSATLNNEYTQLAAELTRIQQQTKFNGQKILDTDAGAKVFQVGSDATDTVTITTTSIGSMFSAAAGGNISTAGAATTAIGNLDSAITAISAERSVYGGAMSRFEGITTLLDSNITNTSAAKSRIMDADIAAETANLTRLQIQQQAATAMLAQANQNQSLILKLLQ